MNALFAFYCIACFGLVYGVYRSAALDFRGVGRLSRARPDRGKGTEEDDFVEPREAMEEARRLKVKLRRLARFDVTPRADMHLLVMLGGLAAVATGAGIGFLAPLAMEAAFGGGAAPSSSASGPTNLATLSYAVDKPLGRLAQMIGAGCGGAIALRMLRVFMGFGALLAAVMAFLIVANFVIGRPMLALFGF